ncbi:MAG TPA: TolC family protein [Kofleriaceae bacterium]|jgi:cobalt-zinc-cadmium efflux system outer membrane protein
MKLAVVCALCGTLWEGAAFADEPAPPIRALLADPTQLASWLRVRDPQVESSRAKLDAARAAGAQARVLPNPALGVTTGGFTVGNNNPGQPMQFPLSQTINVAVGVSELFEIGKRGPRRRAADLRAREAGEQSVGSLGDRLGDATAALGKLTYVVAKRDVIAVNLTAARRLRDNEKIRLDNKDLSPLEYERIELDTDELELELGRAEAEVTSAVAECTATLIAPCAATGLDAAALDGGAPLPAQLPETLGAIRARPDRVASQLESDALGEDAALASHRAIPDPTVGVSYELDKYNGDLGQQFIFSLGIPLPFFDRGNHDADAARANAHAISAQDEHEVHEARGLVESLIAQRSTLQVTLEKLERDQIPKSTKIIEQTQKAFDLGEVRLADLLLVERAHRDLLAEVLETRFDLFSVRAQLRQALGLDDEVARTVDGKARGPNE